jgi:PTS system nitrogen regulatory IIA component
MELAKLLAPEAVKVYPNITSKKRLFQELGEIVFAVHGVAAGVVLDALQDRESLGPTGVGHGIALPHARLTGLDTVAAAFVRLEKPIDFDSVDRQPVDLVFGLFAPEDAGVEHLKALALVSRTMRSASLCAKLRSNGNPATLYTILTESQAIRAA